MNNLVSIIGAAVTTSAQATTSLEPESLFENTISFLPLILAIMYTIVMIITVRKVDKSNYLIVAILSVIIYSIMTYSYIMHY